LPHRGCRPQLAARRIYGDTVIPFALAKLLNLPPIVTGVVVLFAAMPTGANAVILEAR